MTHEASMLGTEAKLFDVSQVLGQEGLISARNDPHCVAVIRGQCSQRGDNSLTGDGRGWFSHNGCECAVVVEHEEALSGIPVRLEHKGPVEKRGRDGVLGAAEDIDQPVQERTDPALHILGSDVFVQRFLHGLSLFVAHCQCVVDLVSDTGEVPRVDVNRVLEAARSTAEFGQDQGSIVLALGDNILQGGCVHAISNRGYQSDVCSPQQRKVFVLAQVLGEVLHWLIPEVTVCAGNTADQFVHSAGNLVLVSLCVLLDRGRAGDLNKHHLLVPIGVQLEKALKSH